MSSTPQYYRLISLLADGRFHSGERLARTLGMSRGGVWKNLRGLMNEWELDIYAVRGKGYRLATPMELLDAELISAALLPRTRHALEHLDILVETDSTNRYLLAHPRVQGDGFAAVFAERQSAGRGRRGKHWVSPFGRNIYCSAQWCLADAAQAIEGFSLGLGLAVARALEQQGVSGVQLKWPNDVYLNGKKIAGILVEMSGESTGPCILVAGIGINIQLTNRDLAQIDQACTDLASALPGKRCSRNRLGAALLNAMQDMMTRFLAQGFGAWRDHWLRRDLLKDKSVCLQQADGRRIEGIERGVDERGALLLETPQGVRRFLSGDISLRPNPAAS